jgi:hypothetical protein
VYEPQRCIKKLISDQKAINIYKYFSDEYVWPRGYPISCINNSDNYSIMQGSSKDIGVWQSLADNDPDVEDEIECHLKVDKLIDLLESIQFSDSVQNNLLSVYERLAGFGIVTKKECRTLEIWNEDFNKACLMDTNNE